MKLFAVIVLQE